MSGKPPSLDELVESLSSQLQSRAALEQAISKTLKDYVTAADAEIQKLAQSNTLGPDVSADMLKLSQTVIDQTIKTIENGPLPPGASKG